MLRQGHTHEYIIKQHKQNIIYRRRIPLRLNYKELEENAYE